MGKGNCSDQSCPKLFQNSENLFLYAAAAEQHLLLRRCRDSCINPSGCKGNIWMNASLRYIHQIEIKKDLWNRDYKQLLCLQYIAVCFLQGSTPPVVTDFSRIGKTPFLYFSCFCLFFLSLQSWPWKPAPRFSDLLSVICWMVVYFWLLGRFHNVSRKRQNQFPYLLLFQICMFSNFWIVLHFLPCCFMPPHLMHCKCIYSFTYFTM